MNIPVERKKEEAIKRMKVLGILPETIKEFEKDNLVSLSESPLGGYYWAEKDTQDYIKDIEKRLDMLVYTGIRSYTQFGVLEAFLYVSDYESEWEEERELLKQNETTAYVRNCDDDICSDIGSIGFKLGPAAGLIRTW